MGGGNRLRLGLLVFRNGLGHEWSLATTTFVVGFDAATYGPTFGTMTVTGNCVPACSIAPWIAGHVTPPGIPAPSNAPKLLTPTKK